MFDFDDKGIRKFERTLEKANQTAIPFAVKQTLDSLAFETRTAAQDIINKKMITRNTFTTRSVQVVKVKGLQIKRMESRTGSTADYMETQEFGGVKKRQGKKGTPIPTSIASGEGKGVIPRRKVVRSMHKLSKIRLNKKSAKRYASKKQEIFLRAKEAIESGSKYIYLEDGDKRAIYRIKGRRVGKGRRKISGLRMEMIHNLSHTSVIIPRNPWLDPAVKATVPKAQKIYKQQLVRQLRRLGFK